MKGCSHYGLELVAHSDMQISILKMHLNGDQNNRTCLANDTGLQSSAAKALVLRPMGRTQSAVDLHLL